MTDLTDRVAMVTGGASPIGAACSRALARLGARVAVGYVNGKEAAENLADELGADTGAATALRVDVADPGAVDDAFTAVEMSLGPVTVLVNNAGVVKDGPLLRLEEADWRHVLDVNLTGSYRTARRAMPAMLRAGFGRIVNIGSVSADAGTPFQTNYAASKAGLVGLTRSLAHEVSRMGITANVVAPGLLDTPMTAHLGQHARDAILSRVWTRRSARPDEVAAAVAFCCTCAYFNGQTIRLDGGM